MRLLKLNKVSKEQQAARARAKRALCRFTTAAIGGLRDGEGGEFLQGAFWGSCVVWIAFSIDSSTTLAARRVPARCAGGCSSAVAGQLSCAVTGEGAMRAARECSSYRLP